MYRISGSDRLGTRFAAAAVATLIAVATTAASAETIRFINGTAIDSAVLDYYYESRTQKPAAQATDAEREMLIDELVDIFLLSTGDAAKEVENDPQIKAQLELQRRSLIAQVIAGNFFESVVVSEEEILASYDEQVALAPPLQFKARHILLESQGEAMQVIGELDIGGKFEDLAKERSTGPSGPSGGDLGWFSPNQLVRPFTRAVEALEDGKYTTAPVQTDFGWHVILREESRQTEAPTLDSSREAIVQKLQQDKFKLHLEGLRSEMTE